MSIADSLPPWAVSDADRGVTRCDGFGRVLISRGVDRLNATRVLVPWLRTDDNTDVAGLKHRSDGSVRCVCGHDWHRRGQYGAFCDLATLRAKHAALSPVLTERSRRVWAATEAQAIGYGGIAQVARATGIAASTIQRGLRELAAGDTLPGPRSRKAGGGRKRATELDATLLRDLDALVEPTAPGDPDSPLRWTCLSARTLAVALEGLGHHIGWAFTSGRRAGRFAAHGVVGPIGTPSSIA